MGLANGTNYDVDVVAINAVGISGASTAAATTFAIPDAPAGLTATPGHGQIALTWDAPASDGGTPVTSYVVEFRTAGGTWNTFVPGGTGSGGAGGVRSALELAVTTSTSTTVTGLDDATAYDFRVSALNAVGTSTLSTVSSATTFSAPTEPTNLKVTISKTTATLTWDAPSSDGGTPATAYTVLYRADGSTSWTRVDAGVDTSATIKNLTAGATYSFEVLAANDVGDGAPTATVTRKVPAQVIAFTGFDPSTLAWALLLLITGAGTVMVRRRLASLAAHHDSPSDAATPR